MKTNTYKGKKSVAILVYLLLILTVFITSGCKKKEQAFPFWMAALTGEEGSASTNADNDDASVNLNPDGDPLPEATANQNAANTNDDDNNQTTASTSGPAQIEGTVEVMVNQNESKPFCDKAGQPEGCLDPSDVTVDLVDETGKVIATTTINGEGDYTFHVDDLPNGDYTVKVKSSEDLASTDQTIEFTYDDSNSGDATVVQVDPIQPYIEAHPAKINGTVEVMANTSESKPYCDNGLPEGCIDPDSVVVQLLDKNGKEIASTTGVDKNGNYSFDLDNLPDGQYTVSVAGSGDMGSSSQTVDFQYADSDAGAATVVQVDKIQPYMEAGKAKISGKIEVMADENNQESYCIGSITTNCFDLSDLKVQLLDPNGNLIKEVSVDENGNYVFNIDNLPNGNYQVYLPSSDSVNTANQNISFTFDPTKTTATEVDVATMKANSKTFENGAAQITGVVKTRGYTDALGNTVLAASAVEGVAVKLYKQDENGDITLGGIKYSDTGKSTTTDASGNYNFDLSAKDGNGDYPLINGQNYLVLIDGSETTLEDRPFIDNTSKFKFEYTVSKSDNSTKQIVDLGETNLQWDAATESALTVSGSINIPTPTGNSKDGFTVNLKDPAGNILETVTTDSNGNYTLNESGLSNGTYQIEISKEGFETISDSINFVADAKGGTVERAMGSIDVLPQLTRVTGSITDGSNDIEGAVINFKPAEDVNPASLQYMIDNYPEYKNLVEKWMFEKTTYGEYRTYASKTYEKDANGNVYFDAKPGKWHAVVSASGYVNQTVGDIVLDGSANKNFDVTMTSSTKRSRIAGTAVVLDTLTDGTKNAYPGFPGYNAQDAIPGLITVMLNSKDAAGNPVAHVAVTGADGSYEFTDLHVVLPSSLSSDAQRVAYAVGEFSKCLQNVSNQMKSESGAVYGTCDTGMNSILTTSTGGTEPLYMDNGKFFFKEGSYSVFTVDPQQHMDSSLTVINNADVAENASVGMTAVATGSSVVPHLPRRKITGTVSDAISTGLLSGVTLNLCTAVASDGTCTPAQRDSDTIPATNRLTGGDINVPSVSTDANGNYSFDNVDPGSYKIQVVKNGYVTGVIDVVVPYDGSGLENGNTVTGVNPRIVKDGAGGDIKGTVVLANATQRIAFSDPYTIELVSTASGSHPIGSVIPSGLQSGQVTYGPNASEFTIRGVNPGEWKIKFVSAGYETVEGLVTVQSEAVTNFEIVTMIPRTDPIVTSSVTGVVRSAMNNRPVEGLTVRIRPGLNVQSGALATDVTGNALPAVTTRNDGSFVIPNVPAGNYTVEIGGSGTSGGVTDEYATTFGTVISAGSDTPASQDFLISPKLGADEVRVVLSWGAQPRDLDSHLEYGSSRPNQVVWNDKNKLGGDLSLDIDVVSGYGPETVTMKGSVWSQARRGYSVYNWTKGRENSSATTIANSGAIVRVFKGSQGLVRTYVAGSGQTNLWWQIFCFDSNKNIIDVGQTGCSASDFFNSPTR